MKPKRVDCELCKHFVHNEIMIRPTCFLGKRVMFRIPKPSNNYKCEYPRYCNDYIQFNT